MAVLFTITLNAGVSAQQGPTQHAELSFVAYLVGRALQLAGTGAGQSLSGNLLDENQTVCGTYQYSPVASQ